MVSFYDDHICAERTCMCNVDEIDTRNKYTYRSQNVEDTKEILKNPKKDFKKFVERKFKKRKK